MRTNYKQVIGYNQPVEKPNYNILKQEYGWQHDTAFLKELTGKKVILVGPAAYMQGSGLGEKIDKYDFIVRMNLSCPIPERLKKDIGSRTDILYHLLMRRQHRARVSSFKMHDPIEIKKWKSEGVKWVILKNDLASLAKRGGDVMAFMKSIKNVINWSNVSGYKYRRLTSRTRNAPNMGTIAIYHLLLSNLKSLHVVGCDFHQTGYYVGYGGFNAQQAKLGEGGGPCWGQGRVRPPRHRVHALRGQLDVLNQILKADKRLHIDEHLARVLEGE
jgi:hypothetical protein